MITHAELASIAGSSYAGPQSATVALDVRYDLLPREGELIIALPGTHPSDALDWLRDLRAFPTWLRLLGPLHSGFGNGANAAWAKFSDRAWGDDHLYTYTGHSLGGAIAQCLAAIHRTSRPTDKVRCVTFGAPRVGFLNPWLGRILKGVVIEYQRDGDIVPGVPLKPLYHHPSRPRIIGKSVGNFILDHSISKYADDLSALHN